MSSTTLYQGVLATSTLNTTQPVAVHAHVKYTTARPFTPEFVQSHLAAGNKSKSRARALYDERVRRRQIGLVERRNQVSREKKNGKEKEKEKEAVARVRAKMGRREAAEKGVWRLREDEARWDAFVPLHRLWLGYMSELLGLCVPSSSAEEEPNRSSPSSPPLPQPAGTMQAKLIKADFHGSIMTVRRSKNAALVGVSGIVVQETENTFKVVTRKNKSKVLPKQGSVFAFAVPLYSTEPDGGGGGGGSKGGADEQPRETETVLDGPHVEIELYGNQFCFRAADRAGRKFKHKETVEL